MSDIQRKHVEIARHSILACGGRIIEEIPLPNEGIRLRFDGVDFAKLNVVLTTLIPDSEFRRVAT